MEDDHLPAGDEVGRPRFKKAQPHTLPVKRLTGVPISLSRDVPRSLSRDVSMLLSSDVSKSLSSDVSKSLSSDVSKSLQNDPCNDLPKKHHNQRSVSLSAPCKINSDVCHDNPSSCCVNDQSGCNDFSFVTTAAVFPEKSVLMGSFHQGHSRFGSVRNKQCGAISLTAILKSKTKSVWSWILQILIMC